MFSNTVDWKSPYALLKQFCFVFHLFIHSFLPFFYLLIDYIYSQLLLVMVMI